jgi:hypothetical protein
VRILFWSAHNTDPILCNYPISAGATPIGSFPLGSYTLQVDRWYQDDLGDGGTITETLGVLPFTVEGTAAPPTPLPALGLPLLVALGALVALFAVSRLRVQRVLLA